MQARESVEAFIERIIAGAHIPRPGDRDDLRRELRAHFEDAGASPDALQRAMHRFGTEGSVAESLRRVHRREYFLFYVAKIAASVIAASVAALLIDVLASVRVEVRAEALRLAPGFLHAAILSAAVVLAMVTAWEVGRAPFRWSRALAAIGAYAAICILAQLMVAGGAGPFLTAALLVVPSAACSRLVARPAGVALTFLVFAVVEYGVHLTLGVAFAPSRALLASAMLVAVWLSTVAILGRVDHAFGAVGETA